MLVYWPGVFCLGFILGAYYLGESPEDKGQSLTSYNVYGVYKRDCSFGRLHESSVYLKELTVYMFKWFIDYKSKTFGKDLKDLKDRLWPLILTFKPAAPSTGHYYIYLEIKITLVSDAIFMF